MGGMSDEDDGEDETKRNVIIMIISVAAAMVVALFALVVILACRSSAKWDADDEARFGPIDRKHRRRKSSRTRTAAGPVSYGVDGAGVRPGDEDDLGEVECCPCLGEASCGTPECSGCACSRPTNPCPGACDSCPACCACRCGRCGERISACCGQAWDGVASCWTASWRGLAACWHATWCCCYGYDDDVDEYFCVSPFAGCSCGCCPCCERAAAAIRNGCYATGASCSRFWSSAFRSFVSCTTACCSDRTKASCATFWSCAWCPCACCKLDESYDDDYGYDDESGRYSSVLDESSSSDDGEKKKKKKKKKKSKRKGHSESSELPEYYDEYDTDFADHVL
ncbi:uncharacterized protein AMSG_08418 [Thecamonas trahens ATCC 50062]|uniref:Uncharacterized protein n=1 Tax=Thecamonas trahens ATCC 50062 TaxID=461836 RepID=A0A0L0DJ58_THETB|nr:hypothetical protein AMSG_08418 [Thecamonas trahens ATCC 50062]KNC52439.1 hypothetical protein AMSG_08418 [Thecamonas trahens ATCC 50062]|eukprot:XP_013755480.1 hypothetical protein AMSG_08418 [Thecamonas trahens ATCC 50062]